VATNLEQFLLAGFIMGMVVAGSVMRMTRTMMLEVLRQDYIRRSSPIRAFLMDAVVMKSIGVVSKRALFSAFVKYCTEMKLAVVTDQTFYRNLPIYFAKNPLQESREDLQGDGKRAPCYRGIQLRREEDWGKPPAEEEQREAEKEGQGKLG